MKTDSTTWCDTNGRLNRKNNLEKPLSQMETINNFLEIGEYTNEEIESIRLKMYEILFPSRFSELSSMFSKIFGKLSKGKQKAETIMTDSQIQMVEYISILNDAVRFTGEMLKEHHLKDYLEGFLIVTNQRKGMINIFDKYFLATHEKILGKSRQPYIAFRQKHTFPEDAQYVDSAQDMLPIRLNKVKQADIEIFLKKIEENTRILGQGTY